MSILKQSTAATIKLGPFVDDKDGKTAETGLTISQADIRLSKNGGDFAQTNNSAGATADEFGYYDVPLDTTDTNTLGRLRVAVLESGALPVWQEFIVVAANVYDSLFSTDKLDCAVVEIATDALTAAAVKADAVTKIQNGLATPTNITAGTITTVTNLTTAPTDMAKESTLTAIKGTGWTNESIMSILNSISLVGGGSSVDEVYSLLSGLLGAGWTNQTIVALKAVVDAIKTKTDQLAFTVANQVDANALTGSATAEDVRIEMDANSTKLAEILTDTGTDGVVLKASGLAADAVTEIQSGLALETTLNAVKAKTDLITTGTVITVTSPVSGSTITAIRGDTLVAVLENIGSLVGYTNLWFTVKRDYADADTASIIQIEKTAGLKYINGAVGTPANGSLTIDDEATGDITIALDETETAKLDPGVYSYDVQVVRTAGTVSTLTAGTFEVAADVTRATA